MQKLISGVKRALPALATTAGSLVLVAGAHAADPTAPDVSGVTNYIGLLPAVVATVAGAVLIVVACVKGFKFIRSAF